MPAMIEVFHLQNCLADGYFHFREQALDRAPDHQRNEVFFGDFANVFRGYECAIAQYGHAVR